MILNEFPDGKVADLIRSESFEDATVEIRSAWRTYLPGHADLLADRIASLPAAQWECDPELLIALGYCNRRACGSNPFAALAYFDASEAAGVVGAQLAIDLALGRARSMCGLGQVADARKQLDEAREALPGLGLSARLSAEALILFVEGECLALAGELDSAGRHLRKGLGLVLDPALPACLEALGWLALIEYFTAEASAPGRTLARVDELANEASTIEGAPALVLRALIAIEGGEFDCARALVDQLERDVNGTEYEVLALYLLSFLEAESDGPLAQLHCLQTVQVAIEDWQVPVLIRTLHDSERAAPLIQLGAIGSARDSAAELARRSPLHAHHAQCPARENARLAQHWGDPEAVLTLTAACRSMGDRHAARSLAYIDVLRAAAHASLGDSTTAAASVDRALLDAATTGWLRPFTSLPPTHLEILVASAESRDQPPAVAGVLAKLRARLGPGQVELIPLMSARERIVLTRIIAGESCQQMSSGLNVSPNTIKSQVRSVYRKLGASNRHEAIDRASKNGFRASPSIQP